MDFLDGLTGFLGSIEAEIAQVLVFLVNLIVEVFQFIWQVIQIIAGYILQAFKATASFFAHLWTNFFKGIFTKLLSGIGKLTQWLQSKLRPIIQFLTKARQFIDRIYKQYFGPILKAIQHVRQFLQILKLLHIKIAAQLDAILGQVQRDINGVFLQIRGILNTAIDLLNIVADPSKLLRKPTMVLSLRRTIHAFIRQVTGMPPGWYFPSPSKSAPRGLGFLPADFNPDNPLHNPPPSYYLSLDSGVPSFDFLGDGETIPDEAADGMAPLGFFDGQAWPDSNCASVETCILTAAQLGLKVQ
jgi:hypothetical protein